MGRYTEIQSFCKPLYIKNSPVVTGKVAVFYDSAQKRRVVLSKTRNLSPKTIVQYQKREVFPLTGMLDTLFRPVQIDLNATVRYKFQKGNRQMAFSLKGVHVPHRKNTAQRTEALCGVLLTDTDGCRWPAAPPG